MSRSPGDSPAGQRGSEPDREVGPCPQPLPLALTWGRGQVDALHDEQDHVVAAEVRKDPSGQAGNRHLSQRRAFAANPTPARVPGLCASFRIGQTGPPFSSATARLLGLWSSRTYLVPTTCQPVPLVLWDLPFHQQYFLSSLLFANQCPCCWGPPLHWLIFLEHLVCTTYMLWDLPFVFLKSY